jgi:hypothetical protein
MYSKLSEHTTVVHPSWLVMHAHEPCSSNVNSHATHTSRVACRSTAIDLQFRIAGRRVLAMVFETVEIFVALLTDVASIGLFLLHSKRTGVGKRGGGINNGESSIFVLFQLLVLVAML